MLIIKVIIEFTHFSPTSPFLPLKKLGNLQVYKVSDGIKREL